MDTATHNNSTEDVQLTITSIEGSVDTPKLDHTPAEPLPVIPESQPDFPATPLFQKNLESELKTTRSQLDEVMEDRDRLFKILERRTAEIERLETDLKNVRKQLETTISAKCDAVRKYEEIQHKMTEIDFKEKRLEQERTLSQNQVAMLSADLKRNILELQQCRKESTMRTLMLEGRLHEQTEELKISALHESQLRETNQILSTKVDEMAREILKLNEDFTTTMKKYQQELAAKSRLADLYRDKCEDAVAEQKDITQVVGELRAALKEATDEYGVLETRSKENDLKSQETIAELTRVVEALQTELSQANDLLEAAKRDNLEISIEKLAPSAVSSSKYSSRGSISQVYSMYVNASEDLDELSVEHEKLKETFTQVVQEIEEKAPEIQRIQLELRRTREAYQTLAREHRSLKAERLHANNKMEMLMVEIGRSVTKVKELQRANKDLSNQVCHLLNNKQQPNTSEDLPVHEAYIKFSDIEELQQNNLKLIKMVRELTSAIDEIEDKNGAADESRTSLVPESTETPATSQELAALTEKLQKSEKMLEIQRQKHDEQLDKKDQALKEALTQLDQLKAQHVEYSTTNFKLRAEIEHKSSQIKLQQKNADVTKRKLQSIEDKSRNSATTIARLETSLAHMRDELRAAQTRLNQAEIDVQNLTKENRNLSRVEAQLRAEHQHQKQHEKVQAQMMSNIESIKNILERQETNRLPSQFEEVSKRCEELEKLLAEEKKNFADYEAQANAAMDQLDSENQRLQDEVGIANDEIEAKSQKIAELLRLAERQLSDESASSESESDEDSDADMSKLKENVVQLRRTGKSFRQQYLEVKTLNELLRSENERIKSHEAHAKAELTKLSENFEKEKNTMKNLLGKARGMIAKLSEENGELKRKAKEELAGPGKESDIDGRNDSKIDCPGHQGQNATQGDQKSTPECPPDTKMTDPGPDAPPAHIHEPETQNDQKSVSDAEKIVNLETETARGAPEPQKTASEPKEDKTDQSEDKMDVRVSQKRPREDDGPSGHESDGSDEEKPEISEKRAKIEDKSDENAETEVKDSEKSKIEVSNDEKSEMDVDGAANKKKDVDGAEKQNMDVDDAEKQKMDVGGAEKKKVESENDDKETAVDEIEETGAEDLENGDDEPEKLDADQNDLMDLATGLGDPKESGPTQPKNQAQDITDTKDTETSSADAPAVQLCPQNEVPAQNEAQKAISESKMADEPENEVKSDKTQISAENTVSAPLIIKNSVSDQENSVKVSPADGAHEILPEDGGSDENPYDSDSEEEEDDDCEVIELESDESD